MRGPLPAGAWHLDATGFPGMKPRTIHADLIHRAQGAADVILHSADSLTMDAPDGIPAGNVDTDFSLAALDAKCGDLLVVRVALVTGDAVPDFEVRLTLP